MVRVEDPTIPYSKIVPERRRSRMFTAGEQFRLDVDGRGASGLRRSTDRTAAIAASASALKGEQLEQTLLIIGFVGGLLADSGVRSYPIGAPTDGAERPSLVVWVSADETRADEYERLAAIGAPGLSIGSRVDGLDGWHNVEGEQLTDRHLFTRHVAASIAAVLGKNAERGSA